MKTFIKSIIAWFATPFTIYNNRRKGREAQAKGIKELQDYLSGIPSRQELAKLSMSARLRDDGDRYHRASLAFVQSNPGKEVGDFDLLSSEQKKTYYRASGYYIS